MCHDSSFWVLYPHRQHCSTAAPEATATGLISVLVQVMPIDALS